MKIHVLRVKLMLCVVSALLFSSCYRMPTEDDVSTIPLTNNPSITHNKENFGLPPMNM